MYPAMTNVRITELGAAVRAPKPLLLVAFFNYAVAPFLHVRAGEAHSSPDQPELMTGLILYQAGALHRHGDHFTFLAKGKHAAGAGDVTVNSIAQMILIPVYANLLIGEVHFDVWLVAESVVLYLGLPLLLGS